MQLGRSNLCVIVDSGLLKRGDVLRAARCAIRAGADMIQLRDKKSPVNVMLKTARLLKAVTKKFGVPLIINDRPEVAIAVCADGVHVGQGDVDISLARRLLGSHRIIGASATDFRQAASAKTKGASYIGAGPIFKTPIKCGRPAKGLSLLARAARLRVPLFAIGGIDHNNVSQLTEKGFCNIAVIRAVCKARDPFTATRKLKKALT